MASAHAAILAAMVKRSNLYKSLIHSARWRSFRRWVLDRDRWLCQSCLRSGFFRAATEVHHLLPVDWARSDEDKERRCFDPSNVESLCRPCHRRAHLELCHDTTRQQRDQRLRQKIDSLLTPRKQ